MAFRPLTAEGESADSLADARTLRLETGVVLAARDVVLVTTGAAGARLVTRRPGGATSGR